MHCAAGQLKTGILSLNCQHNNRSTPEFNSLTHVLTLGLFPETGRNKGRERWGGLLSGSSVCDKVRQRKRCIFAQRNTLSPPWSSMFVTVISVELFLMSEPSTFPVACCLATCAQPCWVAGPWQGVSWYVRSDLCDYSLTCCHPDWHSLERRPITHIKKTVHRG